MVCGGCLSFDHVTTSVCSFTFFLEWCGAINWHGLGRPGWRAASQEYDASVTVPVIREVLRVLCEARLPQGIDGCAGVTPHPALLPSAEVWLEKGDLQSGCCLRDGCCSDPDCLGGSGPTRTRGGVADHRRPRVRRRAGNPPRAVAAARRAHSDWVQRSVVGRWADRHRLGENTLEQRRREERPLDYSGSPTVRGGHELHHRRTNGRVPCISRCTTGYGGALDPPIQGVEYRHALVADRMGPTSTEMGCSRGCSTCSPHRTACRFRLRRAGSGGPCIPYKNVRKAFP